MSTLLIRSALLDGEPADVLVEGDRIREVTRGEIPSDEAGALPRAGAPTRPPEPLPADDAAAPPDRVIDATGLHLLPGLKNGHTHAAMTLFRGWGDDLPLMEWLETRIWPAEGRMNEEHVYHGTRLACLEMIRNGTTFFNDMYWHTGAVARAVEEMGLRALVGSVFVDLGEKAIEERWRRSVETDLERHAGFDPRIGLTLAPHAIYTVSPDNLAWLGDLAREHGLRLHIHLSETEKEVEDCVRAHGMRPTHFLHRLGLVGPDLVAAHGIFLDEEEMALLGEAGATVVTNPVANMKLAVGGIFDYPAARRAGIEVVLGTDGAGSNNNLDLFEEMKVAALVQKHRARDATVLPAAEALALVTTNASRAFDLGSGRIEAGEPADLILVDLSAPSTQPAHDPVSDLVYAANGSAVHTTICAGRVLMHDRVLEFEDEAEILWHAARAARELVE